MAIIVCTGPISNGCSQVIVKNNDLGDPVTGRNIWWNIQYIEIKKNCSKEQTRSQFCSPGSCWRSVPAEVQVLQVEVSEPDLNNALLLELSMKITGRTVGQQWAWYHRPRPPVHDYDTWKPCYVLWKKKEKKKTPVFIDLLLSIVSGVIFPPLPFQICNFPACVSCLIFFPLLSSVLLASLITCTCSHLF